MSQPYAVPGVKKQMAKKTSLLKQRLFSERDSTVCCIKSNEGKPFFIHKCVLRSASLTWNAILENSSVELEQTPLRIPFSNNGVAAMLDFVYNPLLPGIIKKDPKLLHELLRMSNRYQLKGLRMKVANALIKGLNHSNLEELLDDGDEMNCKELVVACKEYLIRYLSELKSTPTWASICAKHPGIVGEIIESQKDDLEAVGRALNSPVSPTYSPLSPVYTPTSPPYSVYSD